jgi:hypothetical protein
MIKSKKCRECDRPAFSKGLCQLHQPKKGIKSSRESTKEKTAVRQEKRNGYFDYHLERCTRSEESFKQISNPTKANICHLIDKGRHPSLEDNLDNYIYLSFSEHERFDLLLFSLRFEDLEKEFKNSWSKACERYNKLLSLCKESTNFTRELQKYLDGREVKS